ncbi:MAG: carboxypeptidase regulatory-like domain-containing protein [Bryobacterales bacterium]|nr:carboxypeptidase regulatory-like domain-containing protein [Bryobacterales bacterium]
MKRTVVAVLAALVVSGLSFGQSGQSIQGLVEDSSGAVIAGAKVTMTNQGTGISRTAETNAAGLYSFALVQVGNYEVKVEVQGFKTETIRDIRVETSAQVRQDFKLEVGAIADKIEISANTVQLNTENATVGAVIENKRIIDLPINGRNMVGLAVLVPGVQFGERTGRGDGMGGFPIPGSGFSVSANGQRETFQVVSLDGVDAKDPRINITNFVPSIEAIEEFKIQTNAFTAEYGFGGGANVQITMKSGTNTLHGTFFEFLRNDVFDAENYFLNFERPKNLDRLKKDPLRRNQFGFVMSGPVFFPKIYNGKNKTFWAFNMEHRLDRITSVQNANFALEEFRRGDFSQLLTPTLIGTTGTLRNPTIIFDPLTGVPFANNILPASRLHPGALKMINDYVPKPQFRLADPLDFNATAGVPQPVNAHTYFMRIDHTFNVNDRVFARLAWDRSNRTANNINPALPVFVKSSVTNLATQWIHSFGPTTINEFRFGFNVSNDLTSNPRTDNTSFDMDSLGIGQFRIFSDNNRKLTPREHGLPRINGLSFPIGENTNGNGYDNMDTVQFGNHVSMFRGKHNIKIGGEVYYITMERGAANVEEGALGFSGNESGYSLASFLLGYPNSSTSPEGLPLTFPRNTRLGGYFHDDWKISPRITVSGGLRWDFIGSPYDSKGLWRTLDFPGDGKGIEGRGAGYQIPGGAKIPAIAPAALGDAGAIPLFPRRNFFMPRLGITFRPTDKWVIRTGAGWFDNINHLNTWTIFNLMPPKSGSLIFSSVTDVAQTIPVTGGNGQPVNLQTRKFRAGEPILTLNDPFLQAAGVAAAPRPVALNYVPPDYKHGDVWKWSFDIQRELPFNTALTVGYVGSKGTHSGNSIGNYNQPPPSPDTNVQARRPYQQFYDPAVPQRGVQTLSTIRYIDSYGESFHHGLQVKADRRFMKGIAAGLSYTFSKSHGDGENGGQEGVTFQDPLNRRASRGRYRFDQTHNMVANFVWELPGRNLKGIAGYVIGGWQTNGILSIRSGFPFNVTQGGDLNTGGPVFPDLVGSPRLDNPSRQQWFNPAAFSRVTCNVPSRPDLCRYGTFGYNVLSGPSQRNLDFSMFKNFLIKEKFNVQFRAEAINSTNTPYFGAPNGIGFTNINQLTPDSTRMGEIRGIVTPMRIMQFGLKLLF